MELQDLNKQREKLSYSGVPTGDFDYGREKPWQRPFSSVKLTTEKSHFKEHIKSVPNPYLILLLGVYLLLAYCTQLIEDDMPRVVRDSEVAVDDSTTFSEEAAWRYLNELMGDQPRVAGTPYHLQKTQDLKRLVDSVAANATLPVRTDWQLTTGDYWIDFTFPHTNYYQNVSNIIAVLEGESGFHSNGTTNTSLLFNCHYDSVPFAIGTSDNAIFCGIMVEVLARLSKRTEKLKHNIVFLFNGAEENPLQGSHAFLSHPWAAGVTSVVNLDAAGMNGKANVFQVTDPRVLAAYSRVSSRPSAQSLGEFLFSSGLVPSDTDFRIFRDFGQIQGIDMAFVKWGAVYHTRYDNPSLVRAGVLQAAGHNLLQIARYLADFTDVAEKQEPLAAVYYDYLNWFLVSYSITASHSLDSTYLILSVLSVLYYLNTVGLRWSMTRELLWSVCGRVVSMVAGVVVVLLITVITVAIDFQLRYLSNPWIVVPLYWVPYFIAAIAASQGFDYWRCTKTSMNRSIRCVQALAASRMCLAVLLFVLICIPSTATMRYLISVPLVWTSFISVVSLSVIRYVRITAWQHLLLELVLSVPLVMWLFSIALRLNSLLLPISGRSVGDTPDYLVAILNVGLAALVANVVSGTELLFSRRRVFVPLLLWAAACVVIMFLPLRPYADDGPAVQRHSWFHTEIVSYDINQNVIERDSGILVTKLDAYTTREIPSILAQQNINVRINEDFEAWCENRVYCNLPLYRIRFGEYLSQSMFIYTEPPAAFDPPARLTLNNRSCVGEMCTLNFTMTGPPHNTLSFAPRAGVSLHSWSLSSPPLPALSLQRRPVYVVVHSSATYSEPLPQLHFSLNLIVPLSQQSAAVLDASHHAFKIFHPESFTAEYSTILNAMPKYLNVATFIAFRSNYVY